YSRLLQERRRLLHAQIVGTIEARAGERVAEQVEHLAYHALRGVERADALAYSPLAGEGVLVRTAYRGATGDLEQALSASPHLAEHREMHEQAIDLRPALPPALLPSADFGRMLTYLREAETLAMPLTTPPQLSRIAAFLANALRSV